MNPCLADGPNTSPSTARDSRQSVAFSGVYGQLCSNLGAATPQNQQPTVQPWDSSRATGACTMASERSVPSSPVHRLIIRSRHARIRGSAGTVCSRSARRCWIFSWMKYR